MRGSSSLIQFICLSWLCCVSGDTSGQTLDAVILVASKDHHIFQYSLPSVLKHLRDVNNVYVIASEADKLREQYNGKLEPRVKFISETSFPFSIKSISSHSKIQMVGWILQQLLKLCAGDVLKLENYVVLDTDMVWFRDVYFIDHRSPPVSVVDPASGATIHLPVMNYATTAQYTSPYYYTASELVGIGLPEPNITTHRSGIVHHMPMAGHILREIYRTAEDIYEAKHSKRLQFWEVVIEIVAQQNTAHPLSEYDLYYHYARQKYPKTVNHRPLAMANGPKVGLYYLGHKGQPGKVATAPDVLDRGRFQKDREKGLLRQMFMDSLMGFDAIAYHHYAARRYCDTLVEDTVKRCQNEPVWNSTTTSCGWSDTLEEAFSHIGSTDNAAQMQIQRAKESMSGCMCAIWSQLIRVGDFRLKRKDVSYPIMKYDVITV
mmetsp:Transcript_8488/g.12661  ORF Transcript_8488/g.12661 Transcript_8488/m.12661 type:complete len:433 (+) Transcript_8488:21-1319(+)